MSVRRSGLAAKWIFETRGTFAMKKQTKKDAGKLALKGSEVRVLPGTELDKFWAAAAAATEFFQLDALATRRPP